MTEIPAPKFVTVCLANAARSPTAEWLLQGQGYNVKSCGTGGIFAYQSCTKQLMTWADRVFVMEDYMKKELNVRFPVSKGKITVLGIPEIGEFTCDKTLIPKIKRALTRAGVRTQDTSNLTRARDKCIEWTSQDRQRKLMRRSGVGIDFFAQYTTVPTWHMAEGAKRLRKRKR